MRHITLPRVVFAMVIVAVSATSSAITLGAICYAQPWQQDLASTHAVLEAEADLVLRWDTPVVHEWRDQDGTVIGSYEATLYDYSNDSMQIGKLKQFDEELATLVHYFASDPVMRGHLVRHGVTDEQLDAMAARFEPSEELEEYLAYHAR